MLVQLLVGLGLDVWRGPVGSFLVLLFCKVVGDVLLLGIQDCIALCNLGSTVPGSGCYGSRCSGVANFGTVILFFAGNM